MALTKKTLKDGPTVYENSSDGRYYKRVVLYDEPTVRDLCKQHGHSNWAEEYNRDINRDFRTEYPNPDYLDHGSDVPIFLQLPLANKRKVNKYQRDMLLLLITGVTGPDTAEFGARIKSSPLNIKKYQYAVTFARALTATEKASLKKLQWAVEIQDSDGKKVGQYATIIAKQEGISINLNILYDYAERSIYVGPVINDRLRHNKAKKTTVPFTVPLVPEIMSRLHKPNTSTTKFPVAISLQRHWFDTNRHSSVFTDDQSDRDKKFNNTLVTLSWIKGFKRAETQYDKFCNRSYWFSLKLKQTLLERFEKHSLLGQSHQVKWAGFPTGKPPVQRLPDPHSDMLLFDACYEQHLEADGTLSDTNDDLKATLANFDWRMAFEGTIDLMDSDKKQLVTITRCAVYLRDSFDFVGSQLLWLGLGDWKAHPPDIKGGVFGGGYTDVDNEMYRTWRENNGIGHDFLVFSDVKDIPPDPSAQFYILEDAWWKGPKDRIEDI